MAPEPNPNVWKPVLVLKDIVRQLQILRVGVEVGGEADAVGSQPAAGEEWSSNMRVKFARTLMTLDAFTMNTWSALAPQLLRLRFDPVEMFEK